MLDGMKEVVLTLSHVDELLNVTNFGIQHLSVYSCCFYSSSRMLTLHF